MPVEVSGDDDGMVPLDQYETEVDVDCWLLGTCEVEEPALESEVSSLDVGGLLLPRLESAFVLEVISVGLSELVDSALESVPAESVEVSMLEALRLESFDVVGSLDESSPDESVIAWLD